MTPDLHGSDEPDSSVRPSLLPFDPSDLVAMRARPADFARMVGVSKQTVSQWIRDGKVTLGPDGKLDPAKATRQVIERSDPARLRARLFKQATATHDELRQRIRDLESQIAAMSIAESLRVEAQRHAHVEETYRKLSTLIDAITANFGALVIAHDAGELGEELDRHMACNFYGQPLDEYEMERLGDDADGSEALAATAGAAVENKIPAEGKDDE